MIVKFELTVRYNCFFGISINLLVLLYYVFLYNGWYDIDFMDSYMIYCYSGKLYMFNF